MNCVFIHQSPRLNVGAANRPPFWSSHGFNTMGDETYVTWRLADKPGNRWLVFIHASDTTRFRGTGGTGTLEVDATLEAIRQTWPDSNLIGPVLFTSMPRGHTRDSHVRIYGIGSIERLVKAVLHGGGTFADLREVEAFLNSWERGDEELGALSVLCQGYLLVIAADAVWANASVDAPPNAPSIDLQTARERQGLTHATIGALFGVSPSQARTWEKDGIPEEMKPLIFTWMVSRHEPTEQQLDDARLRAALRRAGLSAAAPSIDATIVEALKSRSHEVKTATWWRRVLENEPRLISPPRGVEELIGAIFDDRKIEPGLVAKAYLDIAGWDPTDAP